MNDISKEELIGQLAQAKMILHAITRIKPSTTYVETSYNSGSNVPCQHCEKMIELAKIALEALEK